MQEQQNDYMTKKQAEEEELHRQRVQVEDQEKQYAELKQQLEKKEAEIIAQMEQLKQLHSNEQYEFTIRLENALNEKVVLENQLQKAQDEIQSKIEDGKIMQKEEDQRVYKALEDQIQNMINEASIEKDNMIKRQQEEMTELKDQISSMMQIQVKAQVEVVIPEKYEANTQCEIITEKQYSDLLQKSTTQDQKYHILKKKLKKQKEINDQLQQEVNKLQNSLEQTSLQFQTKNQEFNQSENRLRELEVQISKAQTSLKSQQTQINQLTTDKLIIETDLQTTSNEKDQIYQDLKNLLDYKNEMDHLCDQLKTKSDKNKIKQKYLKETLQQREQELDKKEIVLRKVSQSAEDAQKQLKTTTLKLRQIEQTKLKDMKRKIQLQEQQIVDLQQRLKVYLDSSGKTPQVFKGQTPPKHNLYTRQGGAREKSSPIIEVEDNLESSRRFLKSRQLTNANSINDLHQIGIDNKSNRNGLLPDIRDKNSFKNFSTIQNSIERGHFKKESFSANQPTVQDCYDQQVDQFLTKVKDPLFKNNSDGIKGMFSSSSPYQFEDSYSHTIKNLKRKEGSAQQQSLHTLEMIQQNNRHLESSINKNIDKIIYFTPEKSQLNQKASESTIQNRKIIPLNNIKHDPSVPVRTIDRQKIKLKSINKL
ncbi:UNKNOWN [Stylonychia lemnae]|uniref:Uncharacterized protein n=1 Tax=Stylonychia lemnae TaxID=5949 RepID=A0A078AMA3_STYLE|nr:UNKNOWN [Stylonychia lemnae]|eukprot:CDW81973.1 UNKNOWN [Stylonychia lemnae]